MNAKVEGEPSSWMNPRRATALLVFGPLLAVVAQLLDVRISASFTSALDEVGALTYFIVGAGIGVVIQGGLAAALDRRVGRPQIPLSRRQLAACGILDFISVVPWLYAMIHGDTAAVLALGSLAPVLVGGWEMVLGKLGFRRGVPGIGLTLLGAYILLRRVNPASDPLPDLCMPALVVRTVASAIVEVWERKVPNLASYRFIGVRFSVMTGLGIPTAMTALLASGHLFDAADVAAGVPLGVVVLHVTSQVCWFSVNVARVQLKQYLDNVTLPAVAFSTRAALAALAAAGLNAVLPGSFPTATFSPLLLAGATLLVGGAVWLAAVRSLAGATSPPLVELQPIPGE